MRRGAGSISTTTVPEPQTGRLARAPIYELFCAELSGHGVVVARGVFGAWMLVEIENDGPVTILLET